MECPALAGLEDCWKATNFHITSFEKKLSFDQKEKGFRRALKFSISSPDFEPNLATLILYKKSPK